MAKVLLFKIELEGAEVAINSQEQLQKAIKETNQILAKADFGSEAYEKANKTLGVLKNAQKGLADESKRTARQMEIDAGKAGGSYRALNAQLAQLRDSFKNLREEDRKGKIGENLIKQIQKLDQELKDIDASIGQYQRNVGNYASAFSALGGIDLADFATVPGAIAAVGAAVIEGTKYVAEMTEEFRKLRGEISTLTGLEGEQLDSVTARISAVSETFKVETNETLIAANAVAKQLDIPFSEALSKIEEGFIAGSNSQGDFLDQLKEYPAFFKEAELGADALFKVINLSAKEGIYSDKGVDTIKEANLRLRENTTATQAALEGIGLKSSEVQKLIAEKGIGAAIAKVSEQLGKLRADSPAVGTAIADIFGGPGEDAGLSFLLTLKDIDDSTGSLIDRTNAYQAAQERTLQINQHFAEVQNEIAKELAGVGVEAGNLGTQIKTGLLEFVLGGIQAFKSWWESMQPIRDALGKLWQSLGLVNEQGQKTQGVVNVLNGILKANKFVWEIVGRAIGFVIDGIAEFIGGIRGALEYLGILDKDARKAAVNQAAFSKSTKEAAADQQKLGKEAEATSKKLAEYTQKTKTAAVATDQFAKGSVAALRKEIQAIQKQLDEGDPSKAGPLLQKLVQAEQQLEKVEALRAKLRRDIVEGVQSPVAQIETRTGLPTSISPEAPEKIELARYEDFLKTKERLNKKYLDEQLAQEKAAAEARAALAAETQDLIFSGIQATYTILDSLAQNRVQNEIAGLEEKYAKEIELAEGNEALQASLANDLAKKKAKIERDEFERQKRFKIASALTSFAEGVVNILSAPTTIPDPFGSIYKAFRVGILGATTAAQIAEINRSKAARGIIVEGLKNGRIVNGQAVGASHSDPSGGIDLSLNGMPLSIEHGERIDTDEFGAAVVINKNSSARFGRTLHQIRGVPFYGKRALLSLINQKGGGVSFGGKYAQPSRAGIISLVMQNQKGGGSEKTKVVLGADAVAALSSATANEVARAVYSSIVAGMDGTYRKSEREGDLYRRTGVK